METPETVRVSLQKRGVGHVAGFQRCLFSHSHSTQIQKIPKVPFEQQGISVHSLSFWASHSPIGIYQGGQRSETDGSNKRYKNPPVPRRLVAQSPVPGDLPTTYPDPLGPMPRSRVGSEHEKVETGASSSFQFCRLPVRPVSRSSFSDSRALGSIVDKTPFYQGHLHSQAVHVSDRPTDSYGETGVVGSSSYEAHPVASEATLACAGNPREGHSGSWIPSSSSGLVVKRK